MFLWKKYAKFQSLLSRFVDLNLRSPVLSYIKVSNCSALFRINITSHALQVSSNQLIILFVALPCFALERSVPKVIFSAETCIAKAGKSGHSVVAMPQLARNGS